MRHVIAILLIFTMCFGIQPSFGQTKASCSGTVIDKVTNNPMVGVSILIKKTRKVVGRTDEHGKFTVEVPDGTELEFTFVNYVNATAIANSKNEMEVAMTTKDDSDLQDVAVVGFRKVSRDANTGSSIVISGKDLQDVPAASVADLLQGKVAGLNIQNNNGSPGARGAMFVRGLSNISVSGSGANGYLTPTSPLFVIDGVPVDMNSEYQYGFNQGGPGISPLSLIPVEDIEKVEVLKDAAATALWGSRGAYGVILVTTKRGNSEIPIVEYQGKVFYSDIPRLRDVIGGREERMLRIRQLLAYDTSYADALLQINSHPYLSDSLNPYYNNSTNWQAVFYKPTYNHTHNINIRGGSQKFNYKVNMGVFDQKGIIENTGLTRYSLNMNTRYQPSEKFILTAAINSGLAQKRNGSGNGLVQEGVADGTNASSLLPAPSQYSANNEALASISVRDDNKTIQVQPSIDIQWMPVEGIQILSSSNYNFNSSISDNFKPSIINKGNGLTTSYHSRTYSLYNRNSLNYIKTIDKDGEAAHNFNIFVFDEITMDSYRADQSMLSGSANDYLTGPNGYNWYASVAGTFDNAKDSRTFAYGGAFSYNYKLRYVVDFQYRASGTSTNGPNSGFMKSPTISARWNMQNEEWTKSWHWMNESSFRFSYGTTLVPTGDIFSVYGKFAPGTNYNGQQTIVSDFEYAPNVNFKSYTNTSFDVGYEGTFFNNRLSVMYDFYYNTKDNQPFDNALANTTGYQKLVTNDVSTVSYGNELTLSFRSAPSSDEKSLSWNISANVGINHDVLTRLPDNMRQLIKPDAATKYPLLYRIGNTPLQTMVYNTVGVYPTASAVIVDPLTGRPVQVGLGSDVYLTGGSPIWTDLNGDYIIDDNDLVVLGNPLPKLTGGINFYIKYKQWTLNSSISATLFRDVINTALAGKFEHFKDPLFTGSNSNLSNNGVLVPIDGYNYWKVDGDNADFPNPFDYLNAPLMNPYRHNQTLFFEDGSYWKLNNVTLSYMIDKGWSKRFGITSARVYFTGANLLIISPYSGSSPENVTSLGFDNPNGYPNPKNYVLGIDIQF
ncbi:SusC/RagA family TonB-linked outer membrane protein [Arachidicoccus terrestris]|uniref:SusC/RagA family TonB-linked outer membrane protein n=1 Tax=Arachidicoccus terrestris TaxID=2875539 RepID=UPI001CC8246F|nr:SusC/RagA family TonB-linked outer membrane protein [Arachidicoccus terrestris]UAY56443.1 SusC/RagA family TonB-linked outer membrane protein [Arachidicoccus terrestris]